MKIIILKLQRLSDEILMKGMNKNHIKNENEYIDSLSSQMHEIGYKENEIKEKLGDIKKNNETLKSIINIPKEELLMKNADELMVEYIKSKNQ
jgi:seryl-tRNA synthetase